MVGFAKQITFALVIVLIVVSCTEERQVRRAPTKATLIEYNKRLMSMDSLCITQYSDTMGLNPTPTSSGLWLTLHDEGVGEPIKKGETVSLKYTISDLLGHQFYDSENDGLKVFPAGRGHEVAGLDEAIVGMKRNARATLLLIPDKAYGLIGDEKRIGGRIILRYDIEVVDVK